MAHSNEKTIVRHVPVERVRPHESIKVRQADIPASYLALCKNNGAILEPSICAYDATSGNYTLMGHPWNWHAAQCLMYDTIPVIALQGPESVFTPMFSTNSGEHENDIVEWARQLHRALQEQGIKTTELAKKLSMDRSTLAHTLQLRLLIPRCVKAYREGRITKGHAKKLAYLEKEDQNSVLDWMFSHQKTPTTRELQAFLADRRAIDRIEQSKPITTSTTPSKKDPDVIQYERKLSEHFGCVTEITDGKLQIDFGSNYDVLEGVLEKSGFS